VDAPAAPVPSSIHDAAEGPLKRPSSALYEGFRRRRALLVVPVPRRNTLLPESLRNASIWVFITARWYYSLVERDTLEGALEDLCLAENVGVIGYYSLASGFLTGKYCSKADMEGQTRGPRVEKYLNDKGYGVIAALDEIAAKHGAMPGQVAMAWLMARPSVCAPIASATKLSQLDELLKSVDLLLDADDIARLDVASA